MKSDRSALRPGDRRSRAALRSTPTVRSRCMPRTRPFSASRARHGRRSRHGVARRHGGGDAVDRSGSRRRLRPCHEGALLLAAARSDPVDEAWNARRRGHDLNPHDTRSLIGLAYVEGLTGNPSARSSICMQALRVSPRDPMRPTCTSNSPWRVLARSSMPTALPSSLGIREAPGSPRCTLFLATNYVGLGEIERPEPRWRRPVASDRNSLSAT